MLRTIVLATSLGATILYGLGQTNPIDTLTRNAAHWDGRHVRVVGMISDLEERTTLDGRNYDVFRLCNDSCVRVFMDGRPKIADGRRLTVEGTFSAAKRLGDITFENDIEADTPL